MQRPIKIAHRFYPFSLESGTEVLIPGTTEKLCLTHDGTLPIAKFKFLADLEHAYVQYGKKKFPGVKPSFPRLHLGVHRAQDWRMIKRRLDPEEFIPFWYRFGKMMPRQKGAAYAGTFDDLSDLFETEFTGMMVPKSLPFLTSTTDFIESLFFSRDGDDLTLLPSLPKEFHAGRMTGIEFPEFILDIEWSKKKLRRFNLFGKKTGQITIHSKGYGSMNCSYREGETEYYSALKCLSHA